MARLVSLAAVLAMLAAAGPQSARADAKIITLDDDQDAAQSDSDGRYAFRAVEDGYLRMDKQTGEIALCAPNDSGWACQIVPEQHRDYEQEISQLQSEVAEIWIRRVEIRPVTH